MGGRLGRLHHLPFRDFHPDGEQVAESLTARAFPNASNLTPWSRLPAPRRFALQHRALLPLLRARLIEFSQRDKM